MMPDHAFTSSAMLDLAASVFSKRVYHDYVLDRNVMFGTFEDSMLFHLLENGDMLLPYILYKLTGLHTIFPCLF